MNKNLPDESQYDLRVGDDDAEHAYIVTFPITNRINPTFLILADCMQSGLDELVDTWEKDDIFRNLYNTEEDIAKLCDEGEDVDSYTANRNMIVAGNHCYYIDTPEYEQIY